MSDPDSRTVGGRLRNWPTQAISGVGVPDIADNRLDQAPLQSSAHDCTRLLGTGQQLVGVKGLTVNGSSHQPSAQTCSPRPHPPRVCLPRDLPHKTSPLTLDRPLYLWTLRLATHTPQSHLHPSITISRLQLPQ